MGRDNIDDKKSINWGIASLVEAGAIVNFCRFDLINLDTGRARQISLIGAGASVKGSGGSGSVKADYTFFKTLLPFNFNDFDGSGAGIMSASFALYGLSVLQIHLSETLPIATIFMHGVGPGVGASVVKGVILVDYSGNGNPVGKTPVPKITNDHFEKIKKFVPYRIIPNAKPRIVLPDTLFPFNQYNLLPSSQKTLAATGILLNMRSKPEVIIEGHTDSKGSEKFNKLLSERRARSVKQWFINNKVRGANFFKTVGFGEKRPCAPNMLKNANDNPEGRALNRRVEIIADIPHKHM